MLKYKYCVCVWGKFYKYNSNKFKKFYIYIFKFD